MPDLPKRKPNRLKGYDYSRNGGYFLTVCTKDKQKILSRITAVEGVPLPHLTAYGHIVEKHIGMLNTQYPEIQIEKYVIMPNHIHILAVISADHIGTGNPSPTISKVIAWLKYNTTKQINQKRNSPGEKVWQRSFHDHIIRGQKDYDEIWEYIAENPLRWEYDCFY